VFRKNEKHLQPSLISNVSQLPEGQRLRLEQSWAGVFYREVFSRIDETPFGVLYAEIPSRPNIAVNVLVGLEFLKAGFGWTDEALYDAFLYNVQVRYALGYDQLGEGEFDLRTLYYFRERLHRHMQANGVNLLSKAFEQVTDEQVTAFKLRTGMQRMDTTQVSSNIRQWSRLQLLVAVLQRVYRMLSQTDRAGYQDRFQPYVKEHPGHFAYRLKPGDFFPQLQTIGGFIQQLVAELAEVYPGHPEYQMLKRVFAEHFQVTAQGVQGIPDKQLNPQQLLSPDDFEASLRGRRGKLYRGYVANLTETCHPENPLQLITKVQVDSNKVDDPQLLLAALPELKERTDLQQLYTDGGFGSSEVDLAIIQHQVEFLPSGIRGHPPHPEKLSLVDFAIQMEGANLPTQIQCPQGQAVGVELGNQKKGCVARFDPQICTACPFAQNGRCPTKPVRKNPLRHLYFTIQEALIAKRRKHVQTVTKEERNLRAAIEATCRAIKCRFPNYKFPVRGRFRMDCMVVGSAAFNNLRRIHRYLLAS